jgi:hypothetical protein
VEPRAGLDDVEKRKFLTLPGIELLPLGRPTCTQSLYRLHSSGSLLFENKKEMLPHTAIFDKPVFAVFSRISVKQRTHILVEIVQWDGRRENDCTTVGVILCPYVAFPTPPISKSRKLFPTAQIAASIQHPRTVILAVRLRLSCLP